MGVNVYLKPSEIWSFYEKNPVKFEKERVVVAENTETKYEVCVTKHLGHLQFLVYRQDVQQYEELVIDDNDCTRTAKQLYVKYLFPVTVTKNEPVESGKKIPVDTNKHKDDRKASQVKYPLPKVPDNLDEMDDNDIVEVVAELDDEIYQRDDELEMATKDFLAVLLNCDTEEIGELYGRFLVADFIEYACELLAEEFLISVYHPRWYTDEETGVDEYVQYPYLDVEPEEEE